MDLKELLIGFNRIEQLTDEDVENTANQLKVLDLRDNKLHSLPDEIVNLQSLERLDVSNNELSTLPFALGTLPHIKSLMVDGNPMKSIRRDIIQRGTVGLLKYLRSRIDENEEPKSVQNARSTDLLLLKSVVASNTLERQKKGWFYFSYKVKYKV